MVTYRFKSMQIYGKYRFKLYRFKLPFFRTKICIYGNLKYHKCNLNQAFVANFFTFNRHNYRFKSVISTDLNLYTYRFKSVYLQI